MDRVGRTLQELPELALFLCLAVGYAIGRIKIHGFGLGTVVGTLIVALFLGQANITIAPFARTVFFALFMFGVGYQVGPEFFRGLRSGGSRLIAMSLIFCTVGLATIILVSKLVGLDKGLAAGMLSGALTQSSAIGTATEAIQRLSLDEEARKVLASHVPIGDAVTYVFGTAGVMLFLTKAVPRLGRFDLRAEALQYEKELGGGGESSRSVVFDAYVAVDVQAFRLVDGAVAGREVAEAERSLSSEYARLCIQQVHRGRQVFTPGKEEVLLPGDVIAISGSRERLLEVQSRLGVQVVDPEVMDIPFESATIIVTNKAAVARTLLELVRSVDPRGVHLRRIRRLGNELPRLPNTRLERGDLLDVAGRRDELDRVGAALGFIDRPGDVSDITFMGLAVALGGLLGMVSLQVGQVPVSLGTGGGVLLAGLLFGWIHSIRPKWGRIPGPAVWLLQTLGLNTFVALVGLSAASHLVEAMRSSGVSLLLAGIVVSLVPHATVALLGRYAFKMNGAILVGACAGAGTVTPALSAAIEEAESRVPTLGYTIPYALSNVLVTALGPVVVALA
jgi:putative transport protein